MASSESEVDRILTDKNGKTLKENTFYTIENTLAVLYFTGAYKDGKAVFKDPLGNEQLLDNKASQLYTLLKDPMNFAQSLRRLATSIEGTVLGSKEPN